jgi:hypothetical protein
MNKAGIITYVSIICAIHTCFSQSEMSKNLGKITQAYIDAKEFSADVNVEGYRKKQDLSGIVIGKGLIRKSKENYYSRFKDDEMIVNKKCMLIVDHEQRNVKYFNSADMHKMPTSFEMPKMDSLIKQNDSVVYKGITDGLEHYVFYKAKATITRTDVYVSQTTHFIKNIVYYYTTSKTEGNYGMYKVVITYENIKLHNVDNSFFSEKKYVDYKNGKPMLQTAYGNYKLIIADKYKPLQ